MEILPGYLLLEMLLGAGAALACLWLLEKQERKAGGKNAFAQGHGSQAGGKKERLAFFDFAKGAAIIGVICVHAGTLASWGEPVKEAFGFALPVFILCSGYLLSRRYAGKLELGAYFQSVFYRIALVYFIFVLALHFLHNGLTLDPAGVALDLLLGRTDNGSYYFIPLMLQLYLIFPILRKNGAALCTAGLIAAWCLSLYFEYQTWLWQTPAWNSNPLANAFAGRYFFFFVLGMRLSKFDFEAMKAKTSAILAGIFLSSAALLGALNNSVYLGYLFQLGVFFTMHAIFKSGKSMLDRIRLAGALEALGKNSLAIYMIHASIIFGLLARIPYGWEGVGGYALLVALSTAISYAAARAFMAAYARMTAGFR